LFFPLSFPGEGEGKKKKNLFDPCSFYTGTKEGKRKKQKKKKNHKNLPSHDVR
jgi:hypothetical protein